MKKLRDIDLHPAPGSGKHELYIFTQPISYVVYKHLRKASIETGGAAKINVYVVPQPRSYSAEVWDSCTDVEIAVNLTAVVEQEPRVRNAALLKLLEEGLTTVVTRFGGSTTPIDALVAEIASTEFTLRERIATARAQDLAVELLLTWNGLDTSCALALRTKSKSRVSAERNICRTFLLPDQPKAHFDGMEIADADLLTIHFKNYDDGQRRFGVKDYDPVSPAVVRLHDEQKKLTTLTVNLRDL
jgi:hypothetical protein